MEKSNIVLKCYNEAVSVVDKEIQPIKVKLEESEGLPYCNLLREKEKLDNVKLRLYDSFYRIMQEVG